MGPYSQYYRTKNNFLKESTGIQTSQFSAVQGEFKTISQFMSSSELKLPLKISGRLITAGEYEEKPYGKVRLLPEELKPIVDRVKDVELYSSHEVYDKIMKGGDVSINEVLGKIVNATWNEEDQGVDFVAEIYDWDVAFKIANNLIKFVSLGFARHVIRDGGNWFYHALEPKEASLVYDPRDPGARFSAVI